MIQNQLFHALSFLDCFPRHAAGFSALIPQLVTARALGRESLNHEADLCHIRCYPASCNKAAVVNALAENR